MLTLLSTVLSFLMGGLPKLLNFFQDRADKSHELKLAQMTKEREMELAERGFAAQARVEEIRTEQIQIDADLKRAEIAGKERDALYAHDIAIGEGTSTWVKNLRASVRPVITYGFFFLLVFIDAGLFYYGMKAGTEFTELAHMLWDDETQALFASIIAFWFGTQAFSKK